MHPFPLPAFNSSSFNFHFRPPKVYPLKRTFSAMIQPTLKLYPPPSPSMMNSGPAFYDPAYHGVRKKLKKDGTAAATRHITLSNEEGRALLDLWRKGSFAGFYQWVQNAKADLKIDFKETERVAKNKNPIFQGTVHLSFPQKAHLSMITAVEQGLSKKEAKAKCFEKIVESLLKSGLISQGLKDKIFLKENQQNQENSKPEPSIDPNVVPATGKPEQNNNNNGLKEEENQIKPTGFFPMAEPMRNPRKQANKLVLQMQEKLKKDKFFEACAIFCKIIDLKSPEWKEVFFLFNYKMFSCFLDFFFNEFYL